MPIKYIRNWELKSFDDIIDVRSPYEYQEDHIPNSTNLPVLNNIEREKIGTIYKNKSAFTAKKNRCLSGFCQYCHSYKKKIINQTR